MNSGRGNATATDVVEDIAADSKARTVTAVRASRLKAIAAADAAIPILRKQGLVRIDGVLSSNLASELLRYCNGAVDDALTAVRSGSVRATDILAPHLLSGNQYEKRHDVKLALEPPVCIALCKVLESLASTYSTLLGEDCELFELSAIAADPGTPSQVLHLDFPHTAAGEIFCLVAFIALHPLEPTMGPTFFAPGSHDSAFRDRMEAAWHPVHGDAQTRASLMRTQPLCRPLLNAGDLVLMDSALWHAGAANVSTARRTLLHVSFARRGGCPSGRSSSLLHPLRGKHFLNEAAKWTAVRFDPAIMYEWACMRPAEE
mmetsp:Transcript_7402/g.12493  ORF Transcript_7402/g.12493 Transcript_7402/m.12493 type:complete len:317 (-) Transcript_7402:59-1009(-)|eukprot:CAMPEP_0119336794 /NCGR_PEP_ID=MMETSP1333-20130426/92590_1 /TAXON_ID=418940 /ORGANISM="Scyphosphaera apsteinii, Strain RCC1455" /LENGTH=316 /DNA_ID=CAMNT_0007347661 /DNA_START=40 /DNA_END=990 /DNA_ORIENTATION=+